MAQQKARSYFGPMIDADPVIPTQEPSHWHWTDLMETKNVVIAGLLLALAWDRGVGKSIARLTKQR